MELQLIIIVTSIMYTLDDFHHLSPNRACIERVAWCCLLWYTSAPPYRHCTLINELLWARVERS